MKKTPTIHNPTHFEPSDYEVENYLDNKRPTYYGQSLPEFEREVKDWEAEMLRTFGTDWRAKVHHCIHCGNGRVRWITAVRHLPTNNVVVFGSDCTARLGFANKVAFKLALLQSRAAAQKIRFKIFQQREAFLAAHPDLAEAIKTLDAPVHAKNTFVKDVVAKLNQYGSLSDRQVTAVIASVARDKAYAVTQAASAVEVKGNAPTGRTTVTGTVLSTKYQDSDFGPTLKMLLKLENNSRVWLTAPSKYTIDKGDTVTVTATWSPSKDDTSFAFGSRPTMVSMASSTKAVSA